MTRGVRLGTLVLLWLIPVFIFAWALSWDWLATWREFHLPSMLPHFLDLNSIPTGLETLHKGGDPLVANPADPLHRPLNYPRIWLYLFSALGVTRANVPVIALIFCALFLASMSLLIIQAKRCVDMLVLLIASLSLAPLFAMERGNNDLFLFSLVLLGCMATNKTLKSGIFAAATLLKIYPIAAMAVDAIRRPIKERTVPFLLTALVVFLFTLQWYDIFLIRRNTPSSGSISYGVIALREQILSGGLPWGFLTGLGWTVILACWIAGALAAATARLKPWELENSIRSSRYAEMSSIFGAMYVFTYAIGSNWDYRLILLLPTIPLALEMAHSARHRVWGIAHLILVGVAENALAFDQGLEHLATFCLFISVLALLTLQSKDFVPNRKTIILAEA